MLSKSPDAKLELIILLPVLLPVTFWYLPELRAFAPLLTAPLKRPSYGRLTETTFATYGAHLQGSLMGTLQPSAQTDNGRHFSDPQNGLWPQMACKLPGTFRKASGSLPGSLLTLLPKLRSMLDMRLILHCL